MFDLNADDGSVRKKRYESPIPSDTPALSRAQKGNSLDSPKHVALHHRLLNYYTIELDRQYENRRDMAVDADFYDNIQWTDEQAATLQARGQVPLVFNVTATTVDWVIGTEKRSRTDFKVLPRRKDDSKPAQRKSELLKYLADVNKTKFHVSRAFEDAAKVGLGWIEDGYQGDDEGEPLFSRYESWRYMLWDSAAVELDLTDARYVFRTKWVDLDVAQAIFPKRKGMLERSVDDSDNFAMIDSYGDEPMDGPENESQGRGDGTYIADRVTGYRRRRVRIIEMWFKMPVTADKISGGTFKGELFDPASPGHQEAVDEGDGEIVKRPVMRMYVALFTTAGMLWLSPSPYRHNRYPFTPIWNKRRDRDNMPYGLVRNIRDIQSDINKRAAKALHILSSNKIIMEDGAVDDVEELRDEAANPDAIIVKKRGYELTLDTDRELGQWHLELMSRNILMVQQVGGVTDENLGRSTNAVSGIAIQARQEQGALATAKLFDNYRLAQQIRGEKELANIEQFMSEQKQFRITNMRGSPEYVTVNDGLPENSVVRTKADYVIDEDDWRASVRQAQVESLLELLTTLAPVNPQIAVVLMDLVVEAMDIPQREEIVKRIRQVTGMKDPDADDTAPSPEDQAKEQAAAQQQQLAMQTMMAQLRKLTSEAAKNEAQAADMKARTVGANVSSQRSALESAGMAIMAPGITDVADVILHESGFVSRTEDEETMAAAVQAQQAQAAQQAQQQPQQQQDPMALGLG